MTQAYMPPPGKRNFRAPSLYFKEASLPVLFLCGLFAGRQLVAQPNLDAGESKPDAIVESLQSNLIEAMKLGPEIRYPGRYDRLAPIIRGTHQISYIARLTIGRYWNDLSEVDKTKFVEAFGKFVISSYASRFKKYKGEHFEKVTEEPLKRGRVLLVADLYKGNGEPIRFNYVLSRFKDQWRIINVMVKGVSDLALKRAEFTSIIEKDGFPALLAKLDDKVDEIRKKHEEEGT